MKNESPVLLLDACFFKDQNLRSGQCVFVQGYVFATAEPLFFTILLCKLATE